jgi:hypothetical protein
VGYENTLITDIGVDANPSIRVSLSLIVTTSPRKAALLLIHCSRVLKSVINYLFRFYLFFVPDVPIVKDLSDGGQEYGETEWHIQTHWNCIG